MFTYFGIGSNPKFLIFPNWVRAAHLFLSFCVDLRRTRRPTSSCWPQAPASLPCAPTCACSSTTRPARPRTAAESSRAWPGSSWAAGLQMAGSQPKFPVCNMLQQVMNGYDIYWYIPNLWKCGWLLQFWSLEECHTPSLCSMMMSTRSTRRTWQLFGISKRLDNQLLNKLFVG